MSVVIGKYRHSNSRAPRELDSIDLEMAPLGFPHSADEPHPTHAKTGYSGLRRPVWRAALHPKRRARVGFPRDLRTI
jgi:hypothetical protein